MPIGAGDSVKINDIVIGQRVRKDMGNLADLAASIQQHGLLHPVVIKPDNTLIAGHRRIEAAKLLGWTDIPVTVIEVADLLQAERDENAQRKDFTPSEAVAIGRLIEAQERPKAEAREHEGRPSADSAQGGRKVVDIVADAVGMGKTKYTEASAVVAAAERDPAKFGDLPTVMDETNNVHGTYRELERRLGKRGKKRVGTTNKNQDRIERQQFNASIWQQVKDSLINLSSLPDASEVADIVRVHARDKSFVDKKLASAIQWITEFANAWSNGTEAQQSNDTGAPHADARDVGAIVGTQQA